jgi:hypothetical protein
MEFTTMQELAQYRLRLKKAIKRAGGSIDCNAPTEAIESLYRELGLHEEVSP